MADEPVCKDGIQNAQEVIGPLAGFGAWAERAHLRAGGGGPATLRASLHGGREAAAPGSDFPESHSQSQACFGTSVFEADEAAEAEAGAEASAPNPRNMRPRLNAAGSEAASRGPPGGDTPQGSTAEAGELLVSFTGGSDSVGSRRGHSWSLSSVAVEVQTECVGWTSSSSSSASSSSSSL